MKKIILSLFLLGTLLSANAQVPSYVPSNGLVGWWPFSGNANDISGNGNNGTVNGATLTTDRDGISNSAYSFDGVNDNISISSLNNLQYNPITYSFWFNPTSLCVKNSNECWSMMLGRDEAFNVKQGIFTTLNHNNNGTFNRLLYYTGGDDSRPDTTPIVNAWHHLAFTYNSNGIINWYLNGLHLKTDTLVNISSSNIQFNVGSGGGRYYFNGKIDDIGIWNHELSSSEIATLYSKCDKKITQQPSNVNTTKRIVNFTCNANDSLQTYQWQNLNNGNWIDIKDSAQYSGTKTSKLTINQLLVKNNGQKYRCLVKGKCLNTKSEEATLTYNCNSAITQQPANQGMFAGNVTFTCATNDTLVNYQWQTNSGTGWNNLFNAGQYTGSNTNNLLVSNVTSGNNNQLFRCIIKGDCLTDTSKQATLRVWGLGVQSEQVQAFKVYPNPTKGQITIENVDLAKMIGYGLRIYNSLGQQQFQSSVSQERFTLDLTQLGGKGVYFMELTDNNGNIVYVKKIILE